MVNHPGRKVNIYQVGKLSKGAFARASVIKTALKGFEKAGLYRLNRNIFTGHMFAPAETTDRPATQAPQDEAPQAKASQDTPPQAEAPQNKLPQAKSSEATTPQSETPQDKVSQAKVSQASIIKGFKGPRDELFAVPGTS
ncbi:hypothetical protein PR048_005242 [Dryococelus australis]|uniref:Uncharacterized protein n=1 Tax=Dryococelus australis TaxID=614101 RepID=A0ABQ9I7Q8_9NEOP|nr:hypothetical protein PR048_005242 [Dryococelus australis]